MTWAYNLLPFIPHLAHVFALSAPWPFGGSCNNANSPAPPALDPEIPWNKFKEVNLGTVLLNMSSLEVRLLRLSSTVTCIIETTILPAAFCFNDHVLAGTAHHGLILGRVPPRSAELRNSGQAV